MDFCGGLRKGGETDGKKCYLGKAEDRHVDKETGRL